MIAKVINMILLTFLVFKVATKLDLFLRLQVIVKYILEKHQLDFDSKEQNGPLQKKFPIKISASCRILFLDVAK